MGERNPATNAPVNFADLSEMVGDGDVLGDVLTVAGMTIDSSGAGTRVPPPRTIRPRRVPQTNPA